ncbi:hypothetical protein NQ176_g6984 [Zarea fungicola]|uniref:Uncharacterized protein n=1 Tax=Zarea fungicola TaxID=93591 RepID=A0ACC1N0D6_9HYPO|nr:hypothetical protein NQ176_g6984 [Lecanicillium fungicola]
MAQDGGTPGTHGLAFILQAQQLAAVDESDAEEADGVKSYDSDASDTWYHDDDVDIDDLRALDNFDERDVYPVELYLHAPLLRKNYLTTQMIREDGDIPDQITRDYGRPASIQTLGGGASSLPSSGQGIEGLREQETSELLAKLNPSGHDITRIELRARPAVQTADPENLTTKTIRRFATPSWGFDREVLHRLAQSVVESIEFASNGIEEAWEQPSTESDTEDAIEMSAQAQDNDLELFPHHSSQPDASGRQRWDTILTRASDIKISDSRTTAIIDVMVHILQHFPGDKILIASNYITRLGVVRQALKRHGTTRSLAVLDYNGQSNGNLGNNTIDEFGAHDGAAVLLLSARAEKLHVYKMLCINFVIDDFLTRAADEKRTTATSIQGAFMHPDGEVPDCVNVVIAPWPMGEPTATTESIEVATGTGNFTLEQKMNEALEDTEMTG